MWRLRITQNLRFFGDTLEKICDTQMCRDTRFENHCSRLSLVKFEIIDHWVWWPFFYYWLMPNNNDNISQFFIILKNVRNLIEVKMSNHIQLKEQCIERCATENKIAINKEWLKSRFLKNFREKRVSNWRIIVVSFDGKSNYFKIQNNVFIKPVYYVLSTDSFIITHKALNS